MTPFDPESHGGGQFVTTRWTMIHSTRASDASEARRALEALCARYWYPVYAFIRRQGHSPHDAQDLTQSFFVGLLIKDDLTGLDPMKGRFRSWLLCACTNFLKNQHDRAHARKRLPEGGLISLDFRDAEGRYVREPSHARTPEALFTRRWALTLLDGVLGRLEGEAEREGKRALLEHLKPSLMGDPGAVSNAEVGAALGMTDGAVRVAAYRLRKRYRELLHEEIERTVEEPSQVAEEIRELFQALSY